MKKLIAFTAACAAFLMVTAAVAHATVTPSQGTPIVLEHDPPWPPEMVAHGSTNSDGNITFSKLKPGNYTFVLADTGNLKSPAIFRITNVRVNGSQAGLGSAPIPPGKRGASASVVDRSGRKLTVVIDKAGGSITINVSSTGAAVGTLR